MAVTASVRVLYVGRELCWQATADGDFPAMLRRWGEKLMFFPKSGMLRRLAQCTVTMPLWRPNPSNWARL